MNLYSRSGAASINIPRQKLFYAQPARRSNGSLIYGLPPQRMSYIALHDGDTEGADLLNKLSAGLHSDAACFSLLQTIFPSMFPPDQLGTQTPKLRGSRLRVPGMLGCMREILARHARLDVGHHARCMLNRVKVDSKNEGLRSISHSQVRLFLILSALLAEQYRCADLQRSSLKRV